MVPKSTVGLMNSNKNKLAKIIFAKHTLRVYLDTAYFVEIENLLLKVL